MEIYVRRNNDQRGPFELSTIQQGINSGKLLPTDSAWYEGGPGWVFVSQIPGIYVNSILPAQPFQDHSHTSASSSSGYIPAKAASPEPIAVSWLSLLIAEIIFATVYLSLYFALRSTAGEDTANFVNLLFWIPALVWVYKDSKAIEAGRGQVKGILDMSPTMWVWASRGVPGFATYLLTRREIKRFNESCKTELPASTITWEEWRDNNKKIITYSLITIIVFCVVPLVLLVVAVTNR